ncbi:hypothetical protein ACFL1W_01170 [Candidatus Margulisiibacteriota bacterium]
MEIKFGGNSTMTTLKFLWIDDDANRKRSAESIKAYEHRIGTRKIKASVEFLSLRKADAIKTINGIKRFPEFDLVIIDHILTGATGVIRKGTTLAEVIREKAPKCPIVGVTAAINQKGINQHALSMYEDLFILDKLSDSFSSLFTIALTFKKVSRMRLRTSEAKVKLFKSPKDDVQLLKQILPEASASARFDRAFFQWVLHDLIANPGLLYNRSWASNLVGVKENSFSKIERLFDAAKYTGIFCDAEKPLWWKSKLKELIFTNTNNKDESLPWKAGHFLAGISRKDYSICYSCKKHFPETLGYVDTTERSRLVPLHYQHSKPHPAYKSGLYFDEMRLMKDANN